MSLSQDVRERYPEFAKYFDRVHTEPTQAIGEFIDWLGNNGYTITARRMVTETRVNFHTGEEHEHEFETDVPVVQSVERWLCEFYGIDYDQAMREKDDYTRGLLDLIRKANNNDARNETSDLAGA